MTIELMVDFALLASSVIAVVPISHNLSFYLRSVDFGAPFLSCINRAYQK